MPHRLVFTGSMDWYPNEDAVLHFIDAILPAIRREVPDVSLTVVGRNPTPRLRAAAKRGRTSRVTGTVDDVRPYVAEAAVCVVPLRVGGGTRLKIFEALAMGKAVVSTTDRRRGPAARRPASTICAADEPADFARAVVALLRDPARRRARGRGRGSSRRATRGPGDARLRAADRGGGGGDAMPWPSSQMPAGAPVPRGDR